MGGAAFAQSFADRNRTLSSRILPEAGTAQCARFIQGIAPLGLAMVECDYDWGGDWGDGLLGINHKEHREHKEGEKEAEDE